MPNNAPAIHINLESSCLAYIFQILHTIQQPITGVNIITYCSSQCSGQQNPSSRLDTIFEDVLLSQNIENCENFLRFRDISYMAMDTMKSNYRKYISIRHAIPATIFAEDTVATISDKGWIELWVDGRILPTSGSMMHVSTKLKIQTTMF